MHFCPKHAGLNAPFARVYPGASGLRRGEAAHKVIEREDYTNGDQVQMFGGKAVMAVQTERVDGYDTHVYAPTATIKRSEW